jgi:hypothetical protein
MHREHPDVQRFAARHSAEVRLIDATGSVGLVVRQIASCAAITSSSLHGLVLADSFGIPASWFGLEPELWGGSFKFQDYESVVTPGRSRRATFHAESALSAVVASAALPTRDAWLGLIGELEESLEQVEAQAAPALPRPSCSPAGLTGREPRATLGQSRFATTTKCRNRASTQGALQQELCRSSRSRRVLLPLSTHAVDALAQLHGVASPVEHLDHGGSGEEADVSPVQRAGVSVVPTAAQEAHHDWSVLNARDGSDDSPVLREVVSRLHEHILGSRMCSRTSLKAMRSNGSTASWASASGKLPSTTSCSGFLIGG